jgi:GntR family transcriptional regulator
MNPSPPTSLLRSLKSEHQTLTRATADVIQEAINAGKFPAGTQLPGEPELMGMLGISRSTLREALTILEELGLIIRRRGLGTFVSDKSIVKDMSLNFGIASMISQAGLTPGCINQQVSYVQADSSVAKAYDIPEGSQIILVDRVHTANQRRVVWSLDYVQAEWIDIEILRRSVLVNNSLYEILKNEFQTSITWGEASLLPAKADKMATERLNVARGTLLMRVEQTDYDITNRPVMHSVEYHVLDPFVFKVHRKGPHL